MSELIATAEDKARDLAVDFQRIHTPPRHEIREECGFTSLYSVVDIEPSETALVTDAAIRRALTAEAEVKRLQGMIETMAARIAAQSELLSKRAEGDPSRELLQRLVTQADNLLCDSSDAFHVIAWEIAQDARKLLEGKP